MPDYPGDSLRTVRVFSYGGGVQSNAVLILQSQGKIQPYDYFIFANVGADSENPDTLEYIEKWAKPFAARHSIPFVEVSKKRRDGTTDTLMGFINRTQRSVPIPAFMSNGAPGNRTCTETFKIRVIDKWIKQGKYYAATVGLGISMDEIERMRDTQWHNMNGKQKIGFWKQREFPLINQRLTRHKCVTLTEEAGLPVPPKSSCYFCPFKRRNEWIEFKRNQPDLFQKAVELDIHINEKRNAMGPDRVYLHPDLVPLDQAVGDQMPMFTEEAYGAMCDSGYCMA